MRGNADNVLLTGVYMYSAYFVIYFIKNMRTSQYVTEPVAVTDIPANSQRDTHVIITSTSKRRFDVINTCILRFVFAEMMVVSFKFKLIGP